MVARIRAQALQLVEKGRQATERGDRESMERYYKEWCKLMRLALSFCK